MSADGKEDNVSLFDLRGRPMDDQVAHPGQDAPRLPKRFYKEARATAVEGGFAIQLDGRTVKTPTRQPLIVPAKALGQVVADEWNAQVDYIDPRRMWHTKLTNTALDLVAPRRAAVIADILSFAGTDLVSYRAESPASLAERQAAIWDKLLFWVAESFGAPLKVTTGIMHVKQDDQTIEALRRAVEPFNAFELAGLHNATTLTGSAVIGLALLKDQLDAAAAFDAAHIDEAWQIEMCGEDEEEAARLAVRKSELEATHRFILLARDIV